MRVTNIKQLYTPGIAPYSLIPFKQRKIKRKFKHKVRRYIAAKRNGKDQRIGNKEKVNYNFVIVEANTTYIISSTESSHQDKKNIYTSHSYEIGVYNHALQFISNNSSQFI